MPRFLLISLFASTVATSSVHAQTQNSEEIADTIACLSIADNNERLSCLETAAAALKSTQVVRDAAGETSSGGDTVIPNPVVRNDTDNTFGSESVPQKRKDRDKSRPSTLEAQIAQIKIRSNNRVTLTLANGQVWKQLDSDSHRVIFSNNEKLYTARVRRTAFGGYFLKIKEKINLFACGV